MASQNTKRENDENDNPRPAVRVKLETSRHVTPPATASKALEAKARFTDIGTGEVVTLLSGPPSDISKYVVYKSFACHYSPVLKSFFEENTTGDPAYRLETTDNTAVSFLVKWFYTQKIEPAQLKSQGYNGAETSSVVKLWLLAEKLQIPSLQNNAIKQLDEIQEKFARTTLRDMDYIWDMTLPGCPLRLYYIDRMYSVNFGGSSYRLERLNKKVLADVLMTWQSKMTENERELQRPMNHLQKYLIPEQ